MDIRRALMAEHSKRRTMAVVEYIGDDARRFAELMKLFFAGEYRLAHRAAWPMNYCAERHPELIRLSAYNHRVSKTREGDSRAE